MPGRRAVLCGVASWLIEAALQLSGVQSIALACLLLCLGSGLFVYAALRYFNEKPMIGGVISALIVAATGGAIYFLATHSINAMPSSWTSTVGVNNGINAPGATGGTFNQYNNVPVPLPDSEVEQIKQLDAIFAGRDENALRILFGYGDMVSINIEVNKQRLIEYQRTGSTLFSYDPYIKGGVLYGDFSWAKLVKQNYGAMLILDIKTVPLLVLPAEYNANKDRLLQFENSSFLPIAVIAAVKTFDKALEDNTNLLMKVLNAALVEDHNLFLKHDDLNTPYFRAIEGKYWPQFYLLRPIADNIRDSTRDALRGHDVAR
jgi:hypothetical protein